jgi:hypothetical protein
LIEEFIKRIVETPGADKAIEEVAKHLELSDSKGASGSARIEKIQLAEFLASSALEV